LIDFLFRQPTNVTSDIKKVDEKQNQQVAANFEEDLYNQGVKLFNEKPKKVSHCCLLFSLLIINYSYRDWSF
jgi:hypothetical protein